MTDYFSISLLKFGDEDKTLIHQKIMMLVHNESGSDFKIGSVDKKIIAKILKIIKDFF